MLLKDDDEIVVRMGAEIYFLRNLVEAQKKEIDELKTTIGKLLNAKQKENTDGYESGRDKVFDPTGSYEAESLLRQRGSMDDRRGSYSKGGAAETEAWNVDNAAGS